MTKTMNIWLIVAASLVATGSIAFAAVMTVGDWDFLKLATVKYETNEYELNESFDSVSIETDTADIVFLPADGEKCKVICCELEKIRHSVSVTDGVLTVSAVDTRRWYEHIGVHFGDPKITVYLPKAEYASLLIENGTGNVEIPKNFKFNSIDISVSTGEVKCYASASETVKVEADTGNVGVADISAGRLELSASTGRVTVSNANCAGDLKVRVSTGKAELSDITCQSLISSGSTGKIVLKNVIASERLSVERSTGDVKLEGCDAAEIYVKTGTGDVEGSLLTHKIFVTKTDTGRVDVPDSFTGGRCEIKTDTGNIEITVG